MEMNQGSPGFHTHCHLCTQWEPACPTPQPQARSHSAPGSGTSSRPGSIRRKLQPSGKPVWECTGREGRREPGCPLLAKEKLFYKKGGDSLGARPGGFNL